MVPPRESLKEIKKVEPKKIVMIKKFFSKLFS